MTLFQLALAAAALGGGCYFMERLEMANVELL
jgi:hypothetical protein